MIDDIERVTESTRLAAEQVLVLYEGMPDLAVALLERVSKMGAPPTPVKLVWTVTNKFGNAVWTAVTPFGKYKVFEDGEWWSPSVSTFPGGTGSAGTHEAAFLECQDNFEKRLSECYV